MLPPTENEQEIIKLTLSKESKKALLRAASNRGLSLNEYLLEIVLNAVLEPMAERESIVLSSQDWDTVMSAITSPPELNPKLSEAIKKYKSQYKQS